MQVSVLERGEASGASPYSIRHSGPVLICGSAECFGDDYDRAREMFPEAPAIAVNGAAGHVEALMLFSQHPLKLPRWITAQKSRFGAGFTVHAAGKAHLMTNLGKQQPMPWVEYWWEGVASGGTSAWGARRLARIVGFDLAVLVGVPLIPGGYYGGAMPSKPNQSEAAMKHYREQIMADTAMHEGVRSMSGWTMDYFGFPA